MMKAEYNKQGAARKELADVISQITGEGVKYLFLPTKAYQIGSVLVGKDGTVECEDTALFQRVVQELAVKGFRPENKVAILEEVVTPEETSEMDEIDTLTISFPDDLTDEDFAKLQNLVASKASLFKKALGTNDLTIQREDGKISFPWFHKTDSTKVQAYSKLVTAFAKWPGIPNGSRQKSMKFPMKNTPSGVFSCGWASLEQNIKAIGRSCWKGLAGPQLSGWREKRCGFPIKRCWNSCAGNILLEPGLS